MIGKMSLKEGFVNGHILDGRGRLARVEVDHPIDHQEGIPMGKVFHDLLDVHDGIPFFKRGQGPERGLYFVPIDAIFHKI